MFSFQSLFCLDYIYKWIDRLYYILSDIKAWIFMMSYHIDSESAVFSYEVLSADLDYVVWS